MTRGSAADFWRSVVLGRRLEKLGWQASSVRAYRRIRATLGGRRRDLDQVLTLTADGCGVETTLYVDRSTPELKAEVQALVGAGVFPENYQRRSGPEDEGRGSVVIVHMRGAAAMAEVLRPRARAVDLLKLPAARRSRFIHQVLRRLRKGASGWVAGTAGFQLRRSFGAAGLRWSLLSCPVFARKTGLNWITSLNATGPKDPKEPGLFDRVADELKGAGFQMLFPPGEAGGGPRETLSYVWSFYQDFQSTPEFLKKAAWLSAWRPRA